VVIGTPRTDAESQAAAQLGGCVIREQFPRTPRADFEVPPALPLFCYPAGRAAPERWRLRTRPTPPSTFSYVSTAEDGRRFYASVLQYDARVLPPPPAFNGLELRRLAADAGRTAEGKGDGGGGWFPPTAAALAAALRTAEALGTEGLFRISASEFKLEKLLADLDERGAAAVAGHSVHECAAALKHWLRELPEPLLLNFDALAAASFAAGDEGDARAVAIREKVRELPAEEYSVLKELCGLLGAVADNSEANQMTASNLSRVFTPDLISKATKTFPDFGVVEALIEKRTEIFADGDSGVWKPYDAAELVPRICYGPACWVILSHWPFHRTLVSALLELYRIAALGRQVAKTRSLESYVLQLVLETPLPPPGQMTVVLPFGPLRMRLAFERPAVNKLPMVDTGMFVELFGMLSPPNVLFLVNCLLLEKKVVLRAKSAASLTAASEAALSLLFPFAWCHPYIPVLPLQLIDYLLAPVPFLMGVLSEIEWSPDDEGLDTEEIVVFDLDTNEVSGGCGYEAHLLPEHNTNKLLGQIYDSGLCSTRFSSGHQAHTKHGKFRSSSQKQGTVHFAGFGRGSKDYEAVVGEMKMLMVMGSLQDVPAASTADLHAVDTLRTFFLRAFASMMSGYAAFVKKASDDEEGIPMDSAAFIESKAKDGGEQVQTFLSAFVLTQIFAVFVEARVYGPSETSAADPGRGSDFERLLFDEEIIAKANRNKFQLKKTPTPFRDAKEPCIAPSSARTYTVPELPPLERPAGSDDLPKRSTTTGNLPLQMDPSLAYAPRKVPCFSQQLEDDLAALAKVLNEQSSLSAPQGRPPSKLQALLGHKQFDEWNDARGKEMEGRMRDASAAISKKREQRGIVLVQRNVRKLLAQRECARERKAIIGLQATVRSATAQRRYKHELKSIITVQALWRGKTARGWYLELHNAVILIESRIRGFIARWQYKRTRAAIVAIQTRWRGSFARRKWQRTRKVIISMQAKLRGLEARWHYKKIRFAALQLQALARGQQARETCRGHVDRAYRDAQAELAELWESLGVSLSYCAEFVSAHPGVDGGPGRPGQRVERMPAILAQMTAERSRLREASVRSGAFAACGLSSRPRLGAFPDLQQAVGEKKRQDAEIYERLRGESEAGREALLGEFSVAVAGKKRKKKLLAAIAERVYRGDERAVALALSLVHEPVAVPVEVRV